MGAETNLELVVIAPIPGYPGYLASWSGGIWSERLGRFASPHDNGKGYQQVAVYVNGKWKTVLVHRLIALAFHPNELGLPQVDHINRIKSDNCAENLRWCTWRENNQWSFEAGDRGPVTTPLWAYNIRTRELRFFESTHEAARYTNENQGNFSDALRLPNCRIVGEWLVAKPDEAFPDYPYPLICVETGQRFCNSSELIAAGFHPSDAIRASKNPNKRAGNKKDGLKYHFKHEEITPRNHITDQTCWCRPVQDETDETIWIHNETNQETNQDSHNCA